MCTYSLKESKMCEFLSWIEKGNKIYYLTKKQMDSPKGEMLKERFPGEGELIGHAAIRAYYDIDDGKDCECSDFSTPANFPAVLVAAIKRGDFRGVATPNGLLSQQALAEYEKIVQQAWAEHEKIRQPAWAEYKKIEQLAWAEYKKIEQQALAEYGKIEQQAWAEYEKIRQQAWAEYEKIRQQAFWGLFTNPENRNPNWH